MAIGKESVVTFRGVVTSPHIIQIIIPYKGPHWGGQSVGA